MPFSLQTVKPPALPSVSSAGQMLDMLLGSRSFSRQRPLTQKELFEVVVHACFWRLLPSSIHHGEDISPRPNGDDYLSQAEARKLVQQLLGATLNHWEDERIQGGYLVWRYNTSNSMHEPPRARIKALKADGPKTVSVAFVVEQRIGNLTLQPPVTRLGEGNATLEWGKTGLIVVGLTLPKAMEPSESQRKASPQRSDRTELPLSTGERRALNTFFSNFSEAGVEPFKRGQLSDQQLIRFALLHERINARRQIIRAGKGYVSAGRVDELCLRYFGQKPKRHGVSAPKRLSDHTEYHAGQYSFPLGDGEGPTFSQVRKLRSAPGGLFEAEVEVYSGPNGWEGDPHSSPSSWHDNGDGIPTLDCRMRCLIQNVRTKKAPRYVLLEYQIIENLKRVTQDLKGATQGTRTPLKPRPDVTSALVEAIRSDSPSPLRNYLADRGDPNAKYQ
ncbi:hypothetical protein [Armatimonas sp.]|uniref:hypothetical protein n=1 Tax=Armatimonas sp. TaxID=1872638 RepID=UPI00374D026E